MTARGIVDPGCLGEVETPLDAAVIAAASEALKGSGLIVFVFGYHCSPTWEDVRELYSTSQHKKVSTAWIRKVAARAIKRLQDTARNSRALAAWELQHRKRRAQGR